MAIIGLQTSKSHNNIRIVFLILLMPLVVYLCLLLFFSIYDLNAGYRNLLENDISNNNKSIESIEKQISENNITKNFDFISLEQKTYIQEIISYQPKIYNIKENISYYNWKASDYDLPVSTRRNFENKSKQYSEQLKEIEVTRSEIFNKYYLTEDENTKILLNLYYIQEFSKYLQNTYNGLSTAFGTSFMTLLYSLPLILLWLVVGVSLQKRIIFKFTGAKELERKDNKEIYNIVENLCISRGLPVPKIGIIEDNSMNAFATGWNPKNSHVVFSRGLLDRLDKEEIEAVAGHELTHIINGDVRTMVIVNVFIGIIGTIGYILMRSGSSRSRGSKKGGNPLPLLGLFLYLVSLIVLPLINLAISRKKEFLADAGSVELTKNKQSMISALQKISGDSVIEKIERRNGGIASMFIFDPKSHKKSFFSKVKNLFSTHPSLEERIELLEKY